LLGVLLLAGSCLAYGVSEQVDFGLGRALSGVSRGADGGAGMGGQVDPAEQGGGRQAQKAPDDGGTGAGLNPVQTPALADPALRATGTLTSTPAAPGPAPAARAPVSRGVATPSQTRLEPALVGPPPTAAPTRDGPATTPGRSAATSDPGPLDAVERFYKLVAAHDFASARHLWSPAMQAAYPPAEHLDARFSRTDQIVVQRAELVSLDPERGRAAVAVDLLETPARPAGSRRWVGTWHLVRSSTGWLLDQPALRPG
jgi:hypothetical protein